MWVLSELGFCCCVVGGFGLLFGCVCMSTPMWLFVDGYSSPVPFQARRSAFALTPAFSRRTGERRRTGEGVLSIVGDVVFLRECVVLQGVLGGFETRPYRVFPPTFGFLLLQE